MNEQIEALNTANEYLNNLKNGINKFVEYVDNEKENMAFELIPLIADGIDWISNVVKLTSDVHKGKININGIEEKLTEVAEALENEDYILVSDLFNYEVIPILEQTHQQIRLIIQN